MLPSWLLSLIGGGLIGGAAALLLATQGRIAGISGIAGGLLAGAPSSDRGWRVAFLGAMLGVGALLALLWPSSIGVPEARSLPTLVVAGLLVGFGTRMGNGCTSGHGVCGLSRFSPRSAAATGTFMGAAFVTVALVHFLFGGTL